MEELNITANELYSMLKSHARLGYAAGTKERNLVNVEQKILDTIEGLKKTHKLSRK